jgi:choline transporter-like protein 2/4/5
MTWYNLFGFFWLMEFVTAFGEMVLAGVFAAWYWTRDKNAMACPLGSSFCRAFYHTGTIAFGSLIIGIIRFVRWVIDYLDKKMKGFDNDVMKCFRKCCMCCLWCLEKFMKFVNRNIYIMTAIKGTNFCKSGKDAFNLLMRNFARVVVLNCVVGFVLFIGKLVIMAATGALSYFVLTGWIEELNQVVPEITDLKEYVIIPIGVIVIGAYFITSSFFNVYSMAVDTLFLCFLEDLERNEESGRYFMPKSLLKIIGKMEQYKQARQRDGVDGVPMEPLMKS